MVKWLEGYPIGTKITATDFVMLILVIPYNILNTRAHSLHYSQLMCDGYLKPQALRKKSQVIK